MIGLLTVVELSCLGDLLVSDRLGQVARMTPAQTARLGSVEAKIRRGQARPHRRRRRGFLPLLLEDAVRGRNVLPVLQNRPAHRLLQRLRGASAGDNEDLVGIRYDGGLAGS